jgi:hypothetical protein
MKIDSLNFILFKEVALGVNRWIKTVFLSESVLANKSAQESGWFLVLICVKLFKFMPFNDLISFAVQVLLFPVCWVKLMMQIFTFGYNLCWFCIECYIDIAYGRIWRCPSRQHTQNRWKLRFYKYKKCQMVDQKKYHYNYDDRRRWRVSVWEQVLSVL